LNDSLNGCQTRGVTEPQREGWSWVFAFGEDTHTLRLVSKLPDLQAGYADRQRSKNATRSRSESSNSRQPLGLSFLWSSWVKKAL